jgi:UDP-glucose 4-epimerase
MKVLVTGGQGFIGRHVVQKLLDKGYGVVSFDRHVKKPVEGVENFVGDVRDGKALDQAVYATDAVIHLAGILGTAETLQHIMETVDINVMGTLNVFEAVKKYKKRCVYITLPDVWQNPYSITKRTVKDFALYVYNKELGTEIQVVRGFNVYGEGQKYKPVRKFAPSFIIRALTGQPLQVFGDGSQLVDLVYAGDTADILIKALEAPKVADEVIDAGSGEGVPIIDVANLVSKMTGAQIEYLPMRKGETSKAVIRGDTSTLEKWLGKHEFTPLEKGMTVTVDWYKKHYKELL